MITDKNDETQSETQSGSEALDGFKPITVITFTWCDHHIDDGGGGGVNSRSDINPHDTGWCDL